MRKVVIECPRCRGEGVVVPRGEWEPVLCLRCQGRGWVALRKPFKPVGRGGIRKKGGGEREW
jgi:DnaJ-class molecular chaperone